MNKNPKSAKKYKKHENSGQNSRFGWRQKQMLKIGLSLIGFLMWLIAALLPGDGWGVILVPTIVSLVQHIGLVLSPEFIVFDIWGVVAALMAIMGEILFFVGFFIPNNSKQRPATSQAHEAMIQIVIGALLGLPVIGGSICLIVFLAWLGIGLILAAAILPEGIAGILLFMRGTSIMRQVYQESNEK